MKIQFLSPLKALDVVNDGSGNKIRKIDQISEVDVFEVIDMPNQKVVFANLTNTLDRLLLWEGSAYDTIGQWTDDDVVARVRTLLEAKSTELAAIEESLPANKSQNPISSPGEPILRF